MAMRAATAAVAVLALVGSAFALPQSEMDAVFADDPIYRVWRKTTEDLQAHADALALGPLRRANESCGVNGVASVGTCLTLQPTTSNMPFCGATVSAWTSGSQGVCVMNAGAASTDTNAKSIYDNYSPMLPKDNQDCSTSYKEFVCAVAFPKCVSGSSVYLCQSTCINYFRACQSTFDCSKQSPPDVTVVAGTTGPSTLCTGAATATAPTAVLVALFAVLATLAAAFVSL